MYGNMTREEMIQRLYEGNFTTGELERQLIAKLFEQCCGGGSGGGGVFVVHAAVDDETNRDRLDKTAAEILEASKTMPVMCVGYFEDEGEGSTSVQISYMGEALKEDNNYNFKFYYNSPNGNGTGADSYCTQYRAVNDDDYPLMYNQDSNAGGENLQ